VAAKRHNLLFTICAPKANWLEDCVAVSCAQHFIPYAPERLLQRYRFAVRALSGASAISSVWEIRGLAGSPRHTMLSHDEH
jgi:hypothetical protein